jgi:hypothetical protein
MPPILANWSLGKEKDILETTVPKTLRAGPVASAKAGASLGQGHAQRRS